MSDIETLAYVAGLFDAEGNISIRGFYPNDTNKLRNPSYELTVQLGITDQSVIAWLHNIFDGSITDCTNTPSHVKHGFRPLWRWSTRSHKASQFLEMVLPFLRIKQAQAALAIEFHAHNTKYSGWFQENRTQEILDRNEAYRHQIHSLNMARKQWNHNAMPENQEDEEVISTERTPELLAYIAGLFDGEGNIRISVARPNKSDNSTCHRLQIRLTNTNRKVIPFLQAVFQGSVYDATKPRSLTGRRPAWDWTLYSVAAQQFLELILPYLRIKKQQAVLGIEFQNYLLAHPRTSPANRTQDVMARKEEYRKQIHMLSQHRTPIKDI